MKTTLLLCDVSDAFSSHSRRDFGQTRGERSEEAQTASSSISEGLQQRSCRTVTLCCRRSALASTSRLTFPPRLHISCFFCSSTFTHKHVNTASISLHRTVISSQCYSYSTSSHCRLKTLQQESDDPRRQWEGKEREMGREDKTKMWWHTAGRDQCRRLVFREGRGMLFE